MLRAAWIEDFDHDIPGTNQSTDQLGADGIRRRYVRLDPGRRLPLDDREIHSAILGLVLWLCRPACGRFLPAEDSMPPLPFEAEVTTHTARLAI